MKYKMEKITQGYVLEVVRYNTERENLSDTHAETGRHVGYMKKRFATPQEACDYYNTHHPHMRPLNTRDNIKSDWDPNTKLLYIVREDFSLHTSIPPFS